MSAVLKPVEEPIDEMTIRVAQKVSRAYTRYADILNMSKDELIARALDAFVEEMHDAAAILEARKAIAAGEKTYTWEEVQAENGLI